MPICVRLEEEPEFVPEPGSVMLLASGLMGLAGYAGLRRRRR
ncbi:MAG: PEP-CTERM sorting domain-containing protein [Anaerolineae bacterium]|nr:PEP-CTERM sorting domain-containing protein [Anaerolineae bacterium]NIQ78780.1 PEP-CTERM sorting domain-containing protein [Anaerolineae bacterium]